MNGRLTTTTAEKHVVRSMIGNNTNNCGSKRRIDCPDGMFKDFSEASLEERGISLAYPTQRSRGVMKNAFQSINPLNVSRFSQSIFENLSIAAESAAQVLKKSGLRCHQVMLWFHGPLRVLLIHESIKWSITNWGLLHKDDKNDNWIQYARTVAQRWRKNASQLSRVNWENELAWGTKRIRHIK